MQQLARASTIKQKKSKNRKAGVKSLFLCCKNDINRTAIFTTKFLNVTNYYKTYTPRS